MQVHVVKSRAPQRDQSNSQLSDLLNACRIDAVIHKHTNHVHVVCRPAGFLAQSEFMELPLDPFACPSQVLTVVWFRVVNCDAHHFFGVCTNTLSWLLIFAEFAAFTTFNTSPNGASVS